MILAIIGGGIMLLVLFVLFLLCGENGYPHKCIHANTCPASVRCSHEEDTECYEDGGGYW